VVGDDEVESVFAVVLVNGLLKMLGLVLLKMMLGVEL